MKSYTIFILSFIFNASNAAAAFISATTTTTATATRASPRTPSNNRSSFRHFNDVSDTSSLIPTFVLLQHSHHHQQRHLSTRSSSTRSKTSFGLSTTEMNDATNSSNRNNLASSKQPELSKEEAWQVYLQSQEVQEIRQQLIEKYLSLGRTQEYAEGEIDQFLNDQNRSQKYLEMRKYVKSQRDASMGFENFLFYGGAFFLGLLGDGIFKYISSYQELYPGGNSMPFH